MNSRNRDQSHTFLLHQHEYLTFNIYYTLNLTKSYTKIDILFYILCIFPQDWL